MQGSKGDILALFAGFLFSMLAVIIKKSGSIDAMQPLIWGNLIAVLITSPALFKMDAIILADLAIFLLF